MTDPGRALPPPPPPEARAGTSVTLQVPPLIPGGGRAMTMNGVGTSVTNVVPPPVGARAMTQPGVGTAFSLPVQTQTRVMRPARRQLGEMLVAVGKLSEAQLKGALERQKRTGGRIGELLVAEGLVTDEDVVRALSEQGGIAFISDKVMRTMAVPKALLALLSLEKAERLEAVPVAQQSKELVCAMREPRDLARLDELEFLTGYAVRGISPPRVPSAAPSTASIGVKSRPWGPTGATSAEGEPRRGPTNHAVRRQAGPCPRARAEETALPLVDPPRPAPAPEPVAPPLHLLLQRRSPRAPAALAGAHAAGGRG